jgi:two-component system, OmpR family, alkaline phosphatase synthesis response regulator PhoP
LALYWHIIQMSSEGISEIVGLQSLPVLYWTIGKELISKPKYILGKTEGIAAVSIDCKMGALEARNIIEEASQKGPDTVGKNKKNILIVDDDETILHMLKRYFIREGFQVFVAKNGAEAMERLKVENAPIVLTDLKMPSLSGIELIQFIRQNTKDTAIVVMTAYPEEWSGNEVQAYFVKPFDIEEMFSAIQRILGV